MFLDSIHQKPRQSRIRSKQPRMPKGWINCPLKTSDIICNTFVAFKTPLDSKYHNKIPSKKRLDINILFSSMSMKGVRTCII